MEEVVRILWVIFLLSAVAFGIVAAGLVWLGNKIYLSMKRDEAKTKREIEEENKKE